MQYVYIENYVKISRETKEKFLNIMNRCKEFKVLNEKVIFSEEALILGFLDGSNIQKASEYFKDFYKNIKDIHIDIVKQSFDKRDNMILTFNNTNKQIRV